MSKHKEAFKRIKSVVDSHLLFGEWLQHKSNWGGYIKSVNNIDAEINFDEDMYLVEELVDKATPKKPDKYSLLERDYLGFPTYGSCKKCGTSLLVKNKIQCIYKYDFSLIPASYYNQNQYL